VQYSLSPTDPNSHSLHSDKEALSHSPHVGCPVGPAWRNNPLESGLGRDLGKEDTRTWKMFERGSLPFLYRFTWI